MDRLTETRCKQEEEHKRKLDEEVEKESKKELQAFDYNNPEFNQLPYPCTLGIFSDHMVFQRVHMLAATISYHTKEAQKAWFYLVPKVL